MNEAKAQEALLHVVEFRQESHTIMEAADTYAKAAKLVAHVEACGKLNRDKDYAVARWELEDSPPRSGEFQKCGSGWYCKLAQQYIEGSGK